MQSPAGYGHVFRLYRLIQGCQLQPQLVTVMRLDAGFRARRKKPLDPFVFEAFDHAQVYRVLLRDTITIRDDLFA